MRVLHIAGICPSKPSGGSRSVVDLATRLQANEGVECVVVGTLAAHPVFSEQLADAGVQLVDLFVPSVLRSPLSAIGAIRKIMAVTRGQKIDIVHAHAYVIVPLIIALLKKAALVVTARGVISRLSRISPARYIHKLAYSRAAALVAISNHVKRDLQRGLGLSDAAVRVIHNGCDTNAFSPDAPDRCHKLLQELRDQGRIVLGVVGRVDSDKRCSRALDLAEATLSSFQNLAFVFVGSGQMEEELKAESRRRRLDSRVFFIGHQHDMPSVYPKIDLLLHLCPDEPFGLVFIEAMSCGKPVIAAAGSAAHEIVIPGKTGFICSLEETEEWISAIGSLSDAKLREEMGQSARQRAEESFALNTTCSAYARLYHEVLESREGFNKGDSSGTLDRPTSCQS